jgi:hypothetical protein
MTTLEVLSEARERGLSLTPRGNQFAVRPNRLLSPDFKGKLREFKPALLPLLRTKGVTWIEVLFEAWLARSEFDSLCTAGCLASPILRITRPFLSKSECHLGHTIVSCTRAKRSAKRTA